MLTIESIRKLTVAQLQAEIRSRRGYVRDTVQCLWCLRNYLDDLRDVEPNVVYVPPKKRKKGNTKSCNATTAPVQVVQATTPVQVVQATTPVPVVQELDIPTPPSTPPAIRVFGFSPSAGTCD
jgi:hypothetical protein